MKSQPKPLTQPFDLRTWLNGIGFGQYADEMEAQCIGLDTLLDLTRDELKECGVTLIGHQKAILRAIEELKSAAPAPMEAPESDTRPATTTTSDSGVSLPPEEGAASGRVSATSAPEIPESVPTPDAPAPKTKMQSPAPKAAEDDAEKLPLLQRIGRAYRRASGGSLLFSIAIHAVILVIGTYLVVSQIVEERKISFGGGGEAGPKSEVQHKVKAKSVTAPAPNKRITTTSSLARVALPDMPDIPNNMGPTIAGAMGSGGFGAAGGLGGGGGGGGGSGRGQGNGFSKITFFGLQGGKETDGLVGTFYDLKQTQDRKPTKMKALEKEGVNIKTEENVEYIQLVSRFSRNWSQSALNGFFKAPEKLVAYQIMIPTISANEAPKAFNAEKECAPRRWLIHYQARIVPPRSGKFRFRGRADDILMVRYNGSNALDGNFSLFSIGRSVNTTSESNNGQLVGGKWITMQKGVPADIEIIIGECPGGHFSARLCIEEEGVPYPDGYPVFQVKNVPIPDKAGPGVAKTGLVFGVQPSKPGFGSYAR